MTIYTSGEWHVKAGREEDFARKWLEFGGLGPAEDQSGRGALLLRDKKDALHYRSFGHWPDEAAITQWQVSDAFSRWMAELGEMVDELGSSVFEVVETVGTNADVSVGSAQPMAR
jgi:heme-degrading monooxygenase HmoA